MAPAAAPDSTAALRSNLIATFYHDHRPELADLVAAAELLPDADGFWVQPSAAFVGLSPAWLERKLFAAAVSSGLAVEWVHVLPGAPGSEAFAARMAREGN